MDYWKLNKYENARIVQFSMLITDTQFKYEDVKDYIIKREGFDITNDLITVEWVRFQNI